MFCILNAVETFQNKSFFGSKLLAEKVSSAVKIHPRYGVRCNTTLGQLYRQLLTDSWQKNNLIKNLFLTNA